jgi:hypothetical protein
MQRSRRHTENLNEEVGGQAKIDALPFVSCWHFATLLDVHCLVAIRGKADCRNLRTALPFVTLNRRRPTARPLALTQRARTSNVLV